MPGLIIIRHNGEIERRPLDHVPTHTELHNAIGGYIELVPYWSHFPVDDKTVSRCAVF